MSRSIVRVPVLLLALWIGLVVPAVPGGPAPSAAPPAADPGAVEGGRVLICVLTGALFGAAVMTGNALAAAGAAVGAVRHGCLW